MRRSLKSHSPRLSADSQRLITLAQAVMQASSRIEERAWEQQLDTLAQRLLKTHHQSSIDTALDHVFTQQSPAYEALINSVEAVSESCLIEHQGVTYDGLLIAAPILAWTRFSIGAGQIAPDEVATLSAHLYAHLLAPGARLAMMPHLYSIDQLPRNHQETLVLTQQLSDAALNGSPLQPLPHPAETAPFLADTRYLLAAIAVKHGDPLFCWQENVAPNGREHALEQWKAQATPTISRLIPGCGVELLLPEAYYVACREADKQIRPASIRAAVHYLTHTLGIEPDMLQASIAGFGSDPAQGRVDEYRIGFLPSPANEVVYGVVWPFYGEEEDDAPMFITDISAEMMNSSELDAISPLEEILALLRASGITRIKRHEGCFPMEACEDCGASLFADLDAELVHAEMPEDIQQPGSGHFH